MLRKYNQLIALIFAMVSGSLSAIPFFFDNQSSTIRITSGATLFNNTQASFNGSLVRDTGGNFSLTQPFLFQDAILKDQGNLLYMTNTFDDTTISLTGDSSLGGDFGTVQQNVVVSGTGNTIDGQMIFSSDISLIGANAALSLALQSTVNTNIDMSGVPGGSGILNLQDHLRLSGNSVIIGQGTINGNGFSVIAGDELSTWSTPLVWNSTIELNAYTVLTGGWGFSGPTGTINGHGNVLDLQGTGIIAIASGTTLYLTNLVIKNFIPGPSGSFNFADDTADVILSNTTIELAQAGTTSVGNIIVNGPATFVLRGFNWGFSGTSNLTVDGVTLWTDSAGIPDASRGQVTFGTAANFTFLNDGTIKCATNCADLDALSAQVSVISSEVDVLISETQKLCDVFGCLCVQAVQEDTCFTLDMLPAAGSALLLVFDPCKDRCGTKLRFIFDPSVYGNGGVIPLAPNSSISFSGDGVVELMDGTEFDMQGTSYCLNTNPPANQMLDWPSIVLSGGAILHVDYQATARIGGGPSSAPTGPGGAGCVVIKRGGSIQLDEQSQLIFGNTYNDQLEVSAEFNGAIVVNNPCAIITFQKACTSLLVDHLSTLNIAQGVMEFNMFRGGLTDLNGFVATGVLTQFCIDEGSVFEVLRNGLDSGLVRFAPNFNPDPNFGLGLDIPTQFLNRCSQVCGGGMIQFKEFANIPVTLGQNLPISGGLTVAAGTIFSKNTQVSGQTIFVDTEITADVLIPAGSLIKAGSVINNITLVADETFNTDTVVMRGSVIDANSVIAPYVISGGTALTFGRILPPASLIPAGTILSVGSERVNSTVNLQANEFATTATLVNVFMGLANLPKDGLTQDATILVQNGSFNPATDSQLAALCPPLRNGTQRDGSIVLLNAGDNDVQYNASTGSPVLNQITGYTFAGRQFVITNCDPSTRTETP